MIAIDREQDGFFLILVFFYCYLYMNLHNHEEHIRIMDEYTNNKVYETKNFGPKLHSFAATRLSAPNSLILESAISFSLYKSLNHPEDSIEKAFTS